MKRLLQEPLLHFLLIGTAMFAGYAYLDRDSGGEAPPGEIRLTLDELAQLRMVFVSKWYREPTPEEFNALVENRIQEEILYREALARGLDRNDTIVRRRMAQKMKFLAEDMAAAREPDTDELRAWFAQNGELFALPPRASFRHVYFAADKRRGHAREDAGAALARLAGEAQDSRRAATLGDPFMFQDYYGDRTPGELAREFGPDFAQALRELAPGSWLGPIESGYGWHLVYLDSLVPGRIPAFAEVEPQVKTAWLGEQKALAWDSAYREIRPKYKVLLPQLPQPAVGDEVASRAADRETPQ